MGTTVTDEQIRQLAATAKPYSVAILRWGPQRYMDGAEATELEHQRRMVTLRADGVPLLPLYTSEEGGTVNISSDTWPGTGGVLGLTKAGIEEAKKNNVKPAGGAGFAYIRGPDDALIEVQGVAVVAGK